jgi:hypothetical protein
MSTYALDTDAAKQADTGGGRISETGKYIGFFTEAKKVLSSQGTQGIEFAFEANNGQTANYLTVWTINKDGKQIYGYKQLMALMTCLKVRSIETKLGEVEEYDRNSNSMVKRQAEIFPALMNKPIGVLLQMEEYEKKDLSIGEKAAFAGFFDPQTEQVAVEILEKSEAKLLEKLVSQLVPVKKLKGYRAPAAGSHAPDQAHSHFPNDDEIPF